MLQTMREKVQGIIAISIVVLISLTFALWGIQNYLRGHGGGNVVAKINGIKITRNQFNSVYERTRQHLMLQMGKKFNLDQKTQNQLKQQVLQQLINSTAVFQAAQKIGFEVSMEQIDATLTHLPAFQEGGHFSASRFQQALRGMLYSEEEFVAEMQRDITLNQLQAGIVNTAFILPHETDTFIKLINQTRNIGYTIIPIKKFMPEVKVSAADMQTFYQQNQQQFQTPEKVSIAYVELNADKLKTKVHAIPQEIQQYYEDNIDLYSHPARWYVTRLFVPVAENADVGTIKRAKTKIEALANKAKTGTSFVKLDATYGKPVWLVQGEMSPAFVKNLKQLQPEQTSAIFQAEKGFYVVKLLQAKPEQVLSFAKVESQVKKALMRQKTTQLFDQLNDKLSDLAYTDSSSLAQIAKELDLPIQATDLFTQQGAKTGLLSNPKIIKAAFSDSVLKQNYNSEPIAVAPGKVVVLRIKQHQPVVTKPLAQVKADIVKQLQAKAAGQKAQDLGQKMQGAIKQKQAAAKFAAQHNLTWHTLAKVTPQTKKINQKILMASFGLPKPQAGNPSVTGLILDNNDYAVVQVNQVFSGDVKKLTKRQRNILERKLEVTLGQVDYGTFANAAVKKSNVKTFAESEK